MAEKVITQIHVLTDGTLVGIEVGSPPAVYVSKDGGQTWEQTYGKGDKKAAAKEGA